MCGCASPPSGADPESIVLPVPTLVPPAAPIAAAVVSWADSWLETKSVNDPSVVLKCVEPSRCFFSAGSSLIGR
eukprot:COSAG02_NODE_1328_length_13219_cov_45.612652_22_plen_74_part_00